MNHAKMERKKRRKKLMKQMELLDSSLRQISLCIPLLVDLHLTLFF